jgi:hypothetical protein
MLSVAEGRSRGFASVVLALAMLLLSAMPVSAITYDEGTDPTQEVVDTPVVTEAASGSEGSEGSEGSDPLPGARSLLPGPVDVPDIKQVFQGSSTGESFGEQTAGIGDVNNDGYDDFAVIIPSKGYVKVYHGGPRLVEQTIHPLEGTDLTLSTLSHIRSAGDIDGDQFDDVLVTSPSMYLPSLRAAGAVFVFYGGPSGLKATPDQVLFGDSADLRLGSDVDTVGDINHDRYNDIIVGAEGWNEGTGEVRLYLGSATGLHTSPIWVWRGDNKGDWFGHAVAGAGDLNNDNEPDFAVGAPFATAGDGSGKVYIFYGTPNLWELKVGAVLIGKMLQSYYGLSIRLNGDVDNDGFSDLIISAPDSVGSQGNTGRVELWLGSEHGIDDDPDAEPNWAFDGESDSAHLGFSIAFLGDVNWDGFDDVAIGAPHHTSDDKVERGKVYIFFGRKGGFSNTPSVVETGKNSGDQLSKGLANAGDVDGDGYNDVIVGAPYVDGINGVDSGELYLFHGADLTMPPLQADSIEVLDAIDGKMVLSEYKFFRLRLSVTHRTAFETLDHVDLHLDPTGEDIVLRFLRENENLVEVSDPHDLVNGRVYGVRTSSRYTDTYDIIVEVRFHWGFPSSRPLDASFEAVDGHKFHPLRVAGSWSDLAKVVSRLTFSGDLTVTGSRQGKLSDGDWVQGSETLAFEGGPIEYDLSGLGATSGERYYPPRGSFVVDVRDDLGGEWSSMVQGNSVFSIEATTPSISRPGTGYTVSIETPDHAKVFRTEAFVLNVDATEVGFRNQDPSSVISSRYYRASIEVFDVLGPGVEPTSVQYRLDRAGDDKDFSPFMQANVSMVQGTAFAEVDEFFTEGHNYIQWMAFDGVGNGPTYSFIYTIEVDLGNIIFSSPLPGSDTWHNTPRVAVGITIENTQDVAIDLDAIEYRKFTGPGQFPEWNRLPPQGDGDGGSSASRVEVVTNVDLAEGDLNYIQWRARDKIRSELITSPLYRVRIDLTGPAFTSVAPSEDTFQNRREIQAIVVVDDILSGVMEDSIMYQVLGEDTWYKPDSQTHRGGGIECTALVCMREGELNYIRWQARDMVGHISPVFDQHVKVDLTAPTFSEFLPAREVVVTDRMVEVSVRVSDGTDLTVVSGVDLSTLEYTVLRPSVGDWLEWQRPTIHSPTTVVAFYTVQVIIEVDDGDENLIVWRVRDASMPGGDASPNNATSEPWRISARFDIVLPNSPPVIIITEPSSSTVEYGTATFFDAHQSYDNDGDHLVFLWVSDRDGVLGNTAELSTLLSKGEHIITLTLREKDGPLSSERSFSLSVAPPDEARRPLSTFLEQLAVVLILVFVLVTLLLQKFRIREF